MSVTHTVEFVEAMWKEHFDFIGVPYVFVPLAEWDEYILDENQARFGWSIIDIGTCCPELIANQIEHLDEDDRKHYMEMVGWLCDRHITLRVMRRDIGDDDEARHRVIEDELYERAVGSLDLISQVELRALDNGA